MQDRPTAVELLDALGDFMRDRAAHARDRWERFQFQVAANSIDIVSRELRMEDGFMRDEWGGLDALLGAEPMPVEGTDAWRSRMLERNEELSARIRRGDFDGNDDALVRHLWETVVNKARIASPNEQA